MRKRSNALLFVQVALALLGFSASLRVAHASDVAEPAAQALFEQGRKLMLEERYQEACDKFAESYRLTSGVGTLLNLALCHEQIGKAATAYVEYTNALALSIRTNDAARVDIAQQRIAALEPKLARLSITLRDTPAPNGLWLKLDGTTLGPSSVGAPIPVDPGRHRLEVGAKGKKTTSVDITAKAGDNLVPVAVPELADGPVEIPRELSDAAVASPATESRAFGPPKQAPETRMNAVPAPTWLAAGATLGVAAVTATLGTWFGLDAFSHWKKRNQYCRNGSCDSIAVREADSARDAARLSNALFITAVVSAGAGITLVFTARAPASATRSAQAREDSPMMFFAQGQF